MKLRLRIFKREFRKYCGYKVKAFRTCKNRPFILRWNDILTLYSVSIDAVVELSVKRAIRK